MFLYRQALDEVHVPVLDGRQNQFFASFKK